MTRPRRGQEGTDDRGNPMKLSVHIHVVRWVLWRLTCCAWLGLAVGLLARLLAPLMIGQGVLLCVVLSLGAVLASCMPDDETIAAVVWLASYRASSEHHGRLR